MTKDNSYSNDNNEKGGGGGGGGGATTHKLTFLTKIKCVVSSATL